MRAIFGGTFDPVHIGHLYLAKEVQQHFRFASFSFVPAKQNPEKRLGPEAPADARWAMLEIAAETLGKPFNVLDWELKRETPSFTLLTLKEFEHTFSGDRTLVMGNEVFERFESWHQPADILERANLCVVTRHAVTPESFSAPLERLMGDVRHENDATFSWKTRAGRRTLSVFQLDALPFSGTELRETLAATAQRDPERPPAGVLLGVWRYICQKKLYQV